ncbi:MAG: 1-hydroxycarotenoid 3,4-desaturase CrtD [Pseudomonadota bacterium]
MRVAIIGAGLGGLTAAAELAHAGAEVHLFEAADAPGGKARQVPAGGRMVDAGPTVLTMSWVFEALFDALDERLADHVDMRPAEILARHYWPDGSALDLFADPAASEAAIAAFAGGEEAARFAAFSARAKRIYRALAPVFIEAAKPTALGAARGVGLSPRVLADLAPWHSLWSALGRELRDPRLIQLFGRYATYVGGSPFASPALLMLIWHVEAAGVWRIEGGIHAMARALARIAEARGATITYGTRVAEITTGGGRATGLRLEDGRRIAADAVVFNGDPSALGTGLLEGARVATRPVPPHQRSHSALTFTALARPSGRPLAHHTVVFGSDYRGEFDAIARGHLPPEPTTYFCAEDRARGAAIGPERLFAIINAPATGDTRPLPQEEIDRCLTSMHRLLSRSQLALNLMPETVTVTAPQDYERMFPGSGGALYGLSPHGAIAGLKRPGARSRLPGLYLAGGAVHPGAGVPMATLSGRQAATALMADRGSMSPSRPAAMLGGISTASRTTAPMRSPSSSSSAPSSRPTTPGGAAPRPKITAP